MPVRSQKKRANLFKNPFAAAVEGAKDVLRIDKRFGIAPAIRVRDMSEGMDIQRKVRK